MNDWFWLKTNILSSPKYLRINDDGIAKKYNFPKLYAITKVLMANKILYDGLQTIKNERRYRAKVYISSYYSNCEEVVNIEKKALILFKEAACLGCPIAYAIIGYYHENGLAGLPVNYYKAERYYTLGLGNNGLNKKKNSAVGLSLIRLSFLKQYGRPGIIINQCISKKYKKQAKKLGPKITLNWLESLAELEHICSLFIVASSYYNGLGVDRDVEKAYHYAKIAAEYGHSGAQNLVGMINYEGTSSLEKNEEMALKWYCKAAKSNEAAALYNIAMLYENGAVVMQNYQEAFKYYKLASDYGSISGTNIIGFFYEHGIGTKKNKESAFKYYSKAASKGSSFGQYNLGRCFLYGIGIEKNTTTAFKWFELAGIQGHGISYLTLAVMYDVGIKVCQNKRLAKKYYTLAYRNNIKSVSKRLMASIALDVLRASRYLLSPNKINSKNNTLSSMKNSTDTLVGNISTEDLILEDQSSSLISFLINNSFYNNYNYYDDNNNNNNTNDNDNNINNNEISGIVSITKDIDTNHIKNNTTLSQTNIIMDLDEESSTRNTYNDSSYLSLTASNSISTLNVTENDNNHSNSSMIDSSSLELSEIMEYIQQFNTNTTKMRPKKNYLKELPNELKYHIIHSYNLDGILPPEIMNKICQYVVNGKYNFKTKTDFLNYLNIKEFELEEDNSNYRNTEERINSLAEQYHNN